MRIAALLFVAVAPLAAGDARVMTWSGLPETVQANKCSPRKPAPLWGVRLPSWEAPSGTSSEDVRTGVSRPLS